MKRAAAKTRLMRAAKLLIVTRMEIIDIALECGYSGRQSFTEAFSAAYGCSPARFRRAGQYYPIAIAGGEEKGWMRDMKDASMTARMASFGRAWYARNDGKPIFSDTLARDLFTDEEWTRMEDLLISGSAFFGTDAETLKDTIYTHIAPTPVYRAAFCEDAMLTSMRMGTRQIVLLGAGLDTFAFRNPEIVENCPVFELDLALTQADKCDRIARAGWRIPKNLRFVPADLASDDLAAVLKDAGFDPRKRHFSRGWASATIWIERGLNACWRRLLP